MIKVNYNVDISITEQNLRDLIKKEVQTINPDINLNDIQFRVHKGVLVIDVTATAGSMPAVVEESVMAAAEETKPAVKAEEQMDIEDHIAQSQAEEAPFATEEAKPEEQPQVESPKSVLDILSV